jgi:ATP-dependent helicase/nuclease subunit A
LPGWLKAAEVSVMAEQPWRWTDAQRQAITGKGTGLLVSAAAGAGKTAVLAERCAYLIVEASPACGVEDLLVVTFTDAAAAEMRERIAEALRGQLARRAGNSYLQRQLALIDGANISTIHAFCRELLSKYFCQAGVDPNFAVLDADEAELLKHEALEALFRELYGAKTDTAERFRELVELYGEGRDGPIGRFVLSVHDLLRSLVRPGQWLAEAAAIAKPGAGELRRALAEDLRVELAGQVRHCRGQAEFIRRSLAGWSAYAEAIEEYAGQLDQWVGVTAADGGVDEVRAGLAAYCFGSVRTMLGKDTPASVRMARDTAKGILGQIKQDFEQRLAKAHGCDDLEQEAEQMGRTAPFVETVCRIVEQLAVRYDQAKDRLAAVDFDDLQQKCLDLLTCDRATLEPTDIARQLQERFDHVLVDEYQDINSVQDAIISLVSRQNASGRASNLFVVGDVKQSVYRFRQAEPEIFLGRQLAWQERGESVRGRVLWLGENFRSQPGVLEAVNAIFERLMSGGLSRIRYDERARLVPGLEFPSSDQPRELGLPAAEVHVLSRPGAAATDDEDGQGAMRLEGVEREAYLVGRRILELVGGEDEPGALLYEADGEGKWRQRPVSYRDIVVLLRTVRHTAGRMAAVLRQMGVPVFAELSTGYFDSMEVQDVLNLLSIIDNEQQDIPLAAVMRSPLLSPRFSDSDLLRIRGVDGEVPFHQAVRLYADQGADSDLRNRVGALLATFGRWRDVARVRPVAELLDALYAETGYLAYVGGLPDGAQRRVNLLELHERGRQFGQFARQGLFRFVGFIDQLRQDEREVRSPTPLSEAEDVVRIMSIHRSKGLEFPVVIVPQLGKQFNMRDAAGTMIVDRRRHIGLEVVDEERRIRYPTVGHRFVSRQIRDQTLAEELRVLYVALTRARHRLILVGTCRSKDLEVPRARWADYAGALPEAVVVGARSPLDWLLPVLSCQSAGRVCWSEQPRPGVEEKSLFWVGHHGADTVAQWAVPDERGDAKTGISSKRLAELEPIDSPPAGNDEVGEAIARLGAGYDWEALAELPAVISVSELKRRFSLSAEDGEQVRSYLRPRWVDCGPGFVQGRSDKGIDRGIATHLVLRHVDLSGACDEAGLTEQIGKMVGVGLLASGQADLVDLGALAWFFGTDLGARLRSGASEVRRELPFVARVAAERYEQSLVGRQLDPADGILVRGIIDCLVAEAGGLELIDYKTDRVGREGLGRRVELYRGQMRIYAEAISGIWSRPVRACWLVFLSAEHIEPVDA